MRRMPSIRIQMCLTLASSLLLGGCSPEPGAEAGAEHSTQSAQMERKAEPVRVRKDARTLTRKERADYVKAVLKLKKVPSPYTPDISYYDQFVLWHRSLYACDPSMPPGSMPMPHAGPLFLPWHRQYLRMFEDALREVSGNKDITIPYWDWTSEESTRAVFQDDFMGAADGDPSDGYAVTSGPFRKGEWPVTVQPQAWAEQFSLWPHLVRGRAAIPGLFNLPVAADIQAALDTPLYDVAPYGTSSDWRLSFRNAVEGYRDNPGQNSMVCTPDGFMTVLPLNPATMHNAVHGWVGGLLGVSPDGRPLYGTMVLSTSPNDPVFFLHHANIDRLWAEWQSRRGIHTYLPTSGVPGNNVDDMMMPFHEIGLMVTPGDTEDISALGYRYE
jgi:tyrosinase